VHQRYRRQTDGRTTTYSEREHEFTFARNESVALVSTVDVNDNSVNSGKGMRGMDS